MTLASLLDLGTNAFDAEYGGGLSNHLPMTLVALNALGASRERLEAFAARYAKRLVPAPATEPWPNRYAWPSRLGERAAWAAYRSFFARSIAHDGAAAVLADALPTLMPGCGAAAFHGLIRTAYAVSSGHDGELAVGLAYWACRFLNLGDAPANGGEADLGAVITELRGASARWRSEKGLIVERMIDAAREPGFAPLAARLRIDVATLPALALQAATLYADSGNFTVLHLVTSCHALRVLGATQAAAVRDYWQAYAAGFVASRVAGTTPTVGKRSHANWDEIGEAAIASDDEHVIKLVYSCREEFAVSGADVLRSAAARAAFG